MKERTKSYFLLHLLLLLYSASTVFSKLAAGEKFMSLRFILCYGAVILLLGAYALGWQQVIKRLPLSLAYANKAMTVVWGMLAGLIFFGESITAGKVMGALLVIGGVILFAFSDGEAGERPILHETADGETETKRNCPESLETAEGKGAEQV